jgi:Xaa-Pro aminopeptidase
MDTYFDSEFFKGNRQKLRKLFAGTAPIILTANGLVQRTSDTSLAFRQDSNFWYLTGLNEPSLMLVMDKDKEYVILPERSDYQNTFDGSLNPAELSAISGIGTIMDYSTGWKKLKGRLDRVKHVATIAPGPVYYPSHGMYANPAKAALIDKLKSAAPLAELLDLRPHFVKMRVTKQPAELRAIAQAVKVTSATFKDIAKKLPRLTHEYEVEAELSLGFRRRGAYGHSYSPIVASGSHACTLHYVSNNGVMNPKDLVLIDAGAEVSNYAADISRTLALKEPTKRHRLIYAAVKEVQAFAIGLLKPGTILVDYEMEIETFIGEKLRELSLIKTINHDNVRRYYPHGTSHFLGLDVHDVGDYKKPLEPNMVLTVEPGIYIQSEATGVRIEDDILITSKGATLLSQELPRTLW